MPLKIISTQEHNRLGDNGQIVREMRVTWRAGEYDGPYVTYFPLEQFNAGDARAQLETRAAEITKLREG